MPKYAVLKFVICYGHIGAAIVAALISIFSVWLVLEFHVSWVFAIAGVAAGCLVGFLLVVLVDLTQVIAEMLLPQ